MDEQNALSHEALVAEELNGIPGLTNARVIRARRVEVDLDPKLVRDIFAELVKRKGWLHLSTIAGADVKDAFLAVYHVEIDRVLVSFFARLDREKPEIETIVDIVPGVRIFERELWDMFGIMVHGNHSEDTVMLPDDWPKGVFPLRKDVKLGGGDN